MKKTVAAQFGKSAVVFATHLGEAESLRNNPVYVKTRIACSAFSVLSGADAQFFVLALQFGLSENKVLVASSLMQGLMFFSNPAGYIASKVLGVAANVAMTHYLGPDSDPDLRAGVLAISDHFAFQGSSPLAEAGGVTKAESITTSVQSIGTAVGLSVLGHPVLAAISLISPQVAAISTTSTSNLDLVSTAPAHRDFVTSVSKGVASTHQVYLIPGSIENSPLVVLFPDSHDQKTAANHLSADIALLQSAKRLGTGFDVTYFDEISRHRSEAIKVRFGVTYTVWDTSAASPAISRNMGQLFESLVNLELELRSFKEDALLAGTSASFTKVLGKDGQFTVASVLNSLSSDLETLGAILDLPPGIKYTKDYGKLRTLFSVFLAKHEIVSNEAKSDTTRDAALVENVGTFLEGKDSRTVCIVGLGANHLPPVLNLLNNRGIGGVLVMMPDTHDYIKSDVASELKLVPFDANAPVHQEL